jgi:hypothetical protein
MAATAAVLGGCNVFHPTYTYRYRMTVEVMTRQGLRRGSGVLEVAAHKLYKMSAQEAAGSIFTRGQAVVVDLPSGPIFVLVTGQNDVWEQVTRAFKPGFETEA